MDLALELTPPIRWRRLLTLIVGLPKTSRLWAASTGLSYPQPVEAIADLYDVTVALNWSAKNQDPPKYPRPWIKPDVIGGGSGMDSAAYAEWRAKQFQQPEGGDPDVG